MEAAATGRSSTPEANTAAEEFASKRTWQPSSPQCEGAVARAAVPKGLRGSIGYGTTCHPGHQQEQLLPQGGELVAEEGPAVPEAVVVTGAREPGFNQTYHRVAASRLRDAHRARTGSNLRPWAHKGAGAWAYEATADYDEDRGPPYLWCQQYPHCVQWKLAVPGAARSSYGSYLEGAGFPEGLRLWRCLQDSSCSPVCRGLAVAAKDTEGQDGERPAKQRRLHGAAAAANASALRPGSTPLPFPGPHHDDPAELPALGAAEAEQFHRDGYLVLRAAALGTTRRAVCALRAMSLLLCNLAAATVECRQPGPELELVPGETDGLHSVRVWPREEYRVLLSPLRRLLAQLLGEQPELPSACQVAFGAPTGGFGEAFEGRGDERPDDEYHIDGRGSIPNGFALLVGIALSSPPPGSASWGALTVFPGSHRNSALHAAYPKQKRSGAEAAAGAGGAEGRGPRLDIGRPQPVRLEQGDVVIAHSLLAHRRAQNWSEAVRYQLYFRLRPRRARSDPTWERDLPGQPFAVLPGVLTARQVRGRSGRHGEDPVLA
uniref:Phytanoyl-CoA dioxygenase n=1 Tax=Pyrodinium bahamense TaxID=73915 RepID=A0A7S0AB96_9DINO